MRNRKHDIERYLRGELSPAEMNALEKEALSDPFLSEALEGVEHTGADNFLFDLHGLSRSVHDRSRKRKTKTIKMWGWTAGIAATVLLIAVSGFLVVSLLKDQQARQLAMQEEPPVAEDINAPNDTLTIFMPTENARAAADKKAPTQRSVPPVVKQQQAAGETAIARQDDAEKPELVAEAEAEKDKDGFLAQQAQESEKEIAAKDAEREKTRIADITVTEALAKEDEVSRRSEAAKKIEGRAAEKPASPSGAALRSNAVLLKGKVLSAEDGEALPGVHVIVKGTSIATDTDLHGYYQLAVPGGNPRLVFSFIGFESKEVEIGGNAEINVSMNEDITSLSEVVVTSYGSTDESRTETGTFRTAEPGDGRTEFKNYLNNAVKYPPEAIKNKAEGRVTVRFTVQPNGQLTDFEIVRGIGFGCDEELIRAISQGPTWKPGTQDDRPIREKVKVRYKFELPR